MTTAILGFGRFGRALGNLLAQSGQVYRAYDPNGAIGEGPLCGSCGQAIEGAERVVLAMPVPRMAEALQELRPMLKPGQIVLDVGSVKTGPCALMDRVLGDGVPFVGTHPLFGPLSLAREERPLRVVLCPSTRHPAAADQVQSWFEELGCVVLAQDAETHDRNMAQTHVLAFFIAKGLLDMGVGGDMPFAPPSFQGLRSMLEAVRADAGHLFSAIQKENPFASEARSRLVESLGALHHRLGEAATEETIPMPSGSLQDRSPELREVRELIDDVDHEILGLLQRRTQLARRAAQAKSKLGAPILDPAREKALLEDRKQWAQELGLNPGQVEEVFRTLLTVSRRAQAS